MNEAEALARLREKMLTMSFVIGKELIVPYKELANKMASLQAKILEIMRDEIVASLPRYIPRVWVLWLIKHMPRLMVYRLYDFVTR